MTPSNGSILVYVIVGGLIALSVLGLAIRLLMLSDLALWKRILIMMVAAAILIADISLLIVLILFSGIRT